MIHKQALFYVIPAFIPLFSPALNPSSIYSITWQESWYFPWDSMSYSPLTKFTSNHAPPYHCPPLPGYCSQRFSSLQIKELCCLSPFSSWLCLACVSSRVNCYRSFTKIYEEFPTMLIHTYSTLYYALNWLWLICLPFKGGRNHGWMNGWMDGVNEGTDE